MLVHELRSATVDLKVYYWFDSTIYSPNKIQSAMLRLTKHALLEAGISMPDDAREIIFPHGVPIVRFEGKGLPKEGAIERMGAPAPVPHEIPEPATDAEGDLLNKEDSLKLGAEGAQALEDQDNLLQDKKPPRRAPSEGTR